MRYGFFRSFERGVEIEGTAFFECKLDLHEGVLLRYATAGSGYEYSFPDVGSEEWSGDMCILER